MMGIIFKCFPILHPKIIFLHHVTFCNVRFRFNERSCLLKKPYKKLLLLELTLHFEFKVFAFYLLLWQKSCVMLKKIQNPTETNCFI